MISVCVLVIQLYLPECSGEMFFSFRNLSYLRQHKADVGCARGDEEFALNFSVIFV